MVASAQFVGVGQTSLQFGYGRHACPGRFFAAHEIKMIMASFVMHYDVKMPGDLKERYPNLLMGSSVGHHPRHAFSQVQITNDTR